MRRRYATPPIYRLPIRPRISAKPPSCTSCSTRHAKLSICGVNSKASPGTAGALLDGGAATDRYVYSAFGVIESHSGLNDTPFVFVGAHGYYRDDETDLALLDQRQYDPVRGRFISVDPIRFAAGDTNLYAYGGNNPTNSIDPSGLQTIADSRFFDPKDPDQQRMHMYQLYLNGTFRTLDKTANELRRFAMAYPGLTPDMSFHDRVRAVLWLLDPAVARWFNQAMRNGDRQYLHHIEVHPPKLLTPQKRADVKNEEATARFESSIVEEGMEGVLEAASFIIEQAYTGQFWSEFSGCPCVDLSNVYDKSKKKRWEKGVGEGMLIARLYLEGVFSFNAGVVMPYSFLPMHLKEIASQWRLLHFRSSARF